MEIEHASSRFQAAFVWQGMPATVQVRVLGGEMSERCIRLAGEVVHTMLIERNAAFADHVEWARLELDRFWNDVCLAKQ